MKNWVVNNFWIKILSLILAIIAWFYVNGELDKEKRISKEFYKSQFLEHVQKKPTVEKRSINKGYIFKKE